MSAVIVNPGSQTGTQFGLEIFSPLPITVIQNVPGGAIDVVGSLGKDVIRANPAVTTSFNVDGHEGDDTIAGGLSNDSIQGGSGNDQVSGEAGDDVVDGGLGNDIVFGGIGRDQVLGGEGNDSVSGGDGDDEVFGGEGDDALFGDVGNDTLFGDAGNDFILGGAGNDLVRGDVGRDVISGGTGDDVLFGGAGDDQLRGGAGRDILNPGAGKDILWGGAGSDIFIFARGSTGSPQTIDRIGDFSPGEDVVKLSRALLPGSGLQRGQLSDDKFAVVKNIGDRPNDAKIVYALDTGKIYYNPATGTPVPLFAIQRNLTDLQASDITIF